MRADRYKKSISELRLADRGDHTLCCCEYINSDNEQSHLLATLCNCEAVDSVCDHIIRCSPIPESTFQRMASTIGDRIRFPWFDGRGARRINWDICLPLILTPTLLIMGTMNGYITVAILIALPSIMYARYRQWYHLEHMARTPVFFYWGLSSMFCMYLVFQIAVMGLRRVYLLENMLIVTMALTILYAVASIKKEDAPIRRHKKKNSDYVFTNGYTNYNHNNGYVPTGYDAAYSKKNSSLRLIGDRPSPLGSATASLASLDGWPPASASSSSNNSGSSSSPVDPTTASPSFFIGNGVSGGAGQLTSTLRPPPPGADEAVARSASRQCSSSSRESRVSSNNLNNNSRLLGQFKPVKGHSRQSSDVSSVSIYEEAAADSPISLSRQSSDAELTPRTAARISPCLPLQHNGFHHVAHGTYPSGSYHSSGSYQSSGSYPSGGSYHSGGAALPPFCEHCQAPRSARVGHCVICTVCVPCRDHHCIWLDACIGAGNHRTFVMLLALAFVTIVYGAHLSLTTICTPDMFLDYFLLPVDCRWNYTDFYTSIVWVTVLYALGWGVLIGWMLAQQVFLVSQNVTQHERAVMLRTMLREGGGAAARKGSCKGFLVESPYDRGIVENWMAFWTNKRVPYGDASS